MALVTRTDRLKVFRRLGRLFTWSFQRNPNFPVIIAAFEMRVSVLIQWLLWASAPLVDHSCVGGPPNWARIIPANANKTTPLAMLNPEIFIMSARATLQCRSNTDIHRRSEYRLGRLPQRFR